MLTEAVDEVVAQRAAVAVVRIRGVGLAALLQQHRLNLLRQQEYRCQMVVLISLQTAPCKRIYCWFSTCMS
jgi:hypothetical protein